MMLKISSIHSGYGRIPILHGVNLTVEKGESVGILGHNGMGKTTLLKTLMGHLKIRKGQMMFKGDDLSKVSPFVRNRAGMGYVPQGRDIFPALSVLDNLRMGMVSHSVEEKDTLERVLDDFPKLIPLLNRPGEALSGGEQQLLALARCLCGHPRMILLDEPTEGIQPSIIDEMAEILISLKTKHRLTILIVEQNLDFIAALSERVMIMKKGMITAEISPEHLSDPELVSEYVGTSA